MSTLFDDVETLSPPEENNKVGQIQSAMAGIASGIIKVPEGIVSLGAELMDATGMTTDAAARVEQAFDTINIFEEVAEQNAAGKITQALVQIGLPAGAGAKLATTLASKAIKAKKAGRYLNPTAKNFQKGLKKAKQLQLTTGQKIGAVALGGAGGELLVGDVEDIGTIGDVFEAGPTELDRDVQADPQADATRKLLNRVKFSAESVPLTGLVYGTGIRLKLLGQRGKELVYSNDRMKRFFDKAGSILDLEVQLHKKYFYLKEQKRVDKWQIQTLPWSK